MKSRTVSMASFTANFLVDRGQLPNICHRGLSAIRCGFFLNNKTANHERHCNHDDDSFNMVVLACICRCSLNGSDKNDMVDNVDK